MKKTIIILSIIITFITIGIIFFKDKKENLKEEIKELNATIVYKTENSLTVQDEKNIIYTFEFDNTNLNLGNKIVISYTGVLNKNSQIQDVSVIGIKNIENSDEILNDNGIFSQNYLLAYNKLKTMSIDEKIGQILLVRYSEEALENISKYNFSGFVYYKKDFDNKTEKEVKAMINNSQKSSKIPLLIAVDEEGGSVVRVSSNPKLSSEQFKSPSSLYSEGGIDLIKQDTERKSALLSNLGINLNLAPVVDVANDSESYIYNRTLKQDTTITSLYAKAVIESSKKNSVSYTLKHFPGYSNSNDTHTGIATNNKTLNEIKRDDFPPFISGINAGAEAILVSHNIVEAIDEINPSSLSISAHNILRNDLNFTGVIITDDISMGALENIELSAVKAIIAGNDLIITSDYETSFNEIKNAIKNNTIDEELIDKLAFRVLAWKYYKNMFTENLK